MHGLAPRDLDGVMDRARLVLLTDVLEHVADDFAHAFANCWPRPGRARTSC